MRPPPSSKIPSDIMPSDTRRQPSNPAAVIGPLIDMKAVEKVEAHIAGAVKKGAKVVTGGKPRHWEAASSS
jgi:acyl-CoA reductase-like NAD-dependent aldehyde dehydrogenase